MTISAIQMAILVALILLAALFVLFLARRRPRSAALPDAGSPSADQFYKTLSERLERIEDLSRQVGEISNLFLVPHMRGGIGETLLNEYLGNWLPRSAYDLQYTFKSGQRADAVLSLGGHLIAIDSKFPLESLKRSMADPGDALPADARKAIMKHAEDISQKYIQPAEGTLHFALMYIPSERVYYHVFVERDDGLLADALQKGVVPVSPGNLFLYLQTVAYGLRGLALPQSQREIADIAHQLRKEVADLGQGMTLASTHLRNFQRAYDEAGVKLRKLELLVERLGAGSGPAGGTARGPGHDLSSARGDSRQG